jgi:hypothetical protein
MLLEIKGSGSGVQLRSGLAIVLQISAMSARATGASWQEMERDIREEVMKNMIVSLATLTLAATAAFAQTSVQANVPFAFEAGRAVMPAGHYVVTEDAVAQTLTLRNVDTKTSASIRADQASINSDGTIKMMFHRYGSQYFLASVHQGDAGREITLPVSKNEKQQRSMLVASMPNARPQGVEIAMK